MRQQIRRRPTATVLLGTEAGVMAGLLFYALLVTEPPVAYIVAVLAAAGVTAWLALECLLCDWTEREDDGHPVQRHPPSPSWPSGEPTVRQDRPVHAPVRPVEANRADRRRSAPFFRCPPTR